MAEFPKRTQDMLRQSLESGTVTYLAQFLSIAAINPCLCEYIGSTYHYCTSTPKQVTSYHNRVSGPIQAWMDIFLQLN